MITFPFCLICLFRDSILAGSVLQYTKYEGDHSQNKWVVAISWELDQLSIKNYGEKNIYLKRLKSQSEGQERWRKQ